MRNQLNFKSITSAPKDFALERSFEQQSVELKFEAQLLSRHFVKLSGSLKTLLDVDCNLCPQTVSLPIDESFAVVFTDQVYTQGLEYKGCEVIECFEGFIDLDEFIHSELMLIRSDYHYCQKCQSVHETEI